MYFEIFWLSLDLHIYLRIWIFETGQSFIIYVFSFDAELTSLEYYYKLVDMIDKSGCDVPLSVNCNYTFQ